jgi:ribosome-binding protein aMBF1 (putative translation factor)
MVKIFKYNAEGQCNSCGKDTELFICIDMDNTEFDLCEKCYKELEAEIVTSYHGGA